jgi:formamidopyrimidine-DNA glycosylase
MDQRVVVGVGNIYASEALWLAGISPLVQARKISRERYKLLVAAIRKVLKAAIRSGGSTIRSFAAADGDSGYFQQKLNVYDRDGEPCRRCGTPVKSKVLAGRSTYWCVKCQK